jgi:hypothetical protein
MDFIEWSKWKHSEQTSEEFQTVCSFIESGEANGFGVLMGRCKDGRYLCLFDHDTKTLRREQNESEEVFQKRVEHQKTAILIGHTIMTKLPPTKTESSVNNGLHSSILSCTPLEDKDNYHDQAAIELITDGLVIVAPSFGYRNIGSDVIAEMQNPRQWLYHQLQQNCILPKAKEEHLKKSVKAESYNFDIAQLVDLTKFAHRGNSEYQGAHPVHGSTTGNNFTINTEKNFYYCFRCESGGSALHLLAIQNGLINCGDQLRGDNFKKALNFAVDKGYISKEVVAQSKTKTVYKELDETETIYVSRPTVVTNEFIAEMIWSRTELPKYVKYVFQTETFEIVSEIALGELDAKGRTIIYTPPYNDSLKKNTVIVPSSYIECSFEEVFSDIDAFVVLSYDACGQDALVRLLTRIAVGSWFMDRFVADPLYDIAGSGKFAPILPIRGPSQSGKNRLAFVLRLLSYRPYFQMSTYRIPSIFRPIDFWHGSIVLDEADFNNTNEKSELIHFLNCRATGTPISRQNSVDPNKTDVFDNFGITILTQRRGFDDNATESRAIPFYSQSSDKKLPILETDEMLMKGLQLQNKLLYLRMKYYRQVTIDKEAWVSDLSDHRLIAALLPLLALSKFNPALKDTITATAKAVEMAKIEEKANSMDGQLINCLWEKIKEHLFEEYQPNLYYVLESIDVTESDGKEIVQREALTTTMLAEQFKWSPTSIRKALNSLGIAEKGLSPVVRVNGKNVKVIFFMPDLIEKRLKEFVVGYGQDGVTVATVATVATSFIPRGAPKQQTLNVDSAGDKPILALSLESSKFAVEALAKECVSCEPVDNYVSSVSVFKPPFQSVKTTYRYRQYTGGEYCPLCNSAKATVEIMDHKGDEFIRCQSCFEKMMATYTSVNWEPYEYREKQGASLEVC